MLFRWLQSHAQRLNTSSMGPLELIQILLIGSFDRYLASLLSGYPLINELTHNGLVKIDTLIKEMQLLWFCLKCPSLAHQHPFSLSPSVQSITLSGHTPGYIL